MRSYLHYGHRPAGQSGLPSAPCRGGGVLDGGSGRAPPHPDPHVAGSSGRGRRRSQGLPRPFFPARRSSQTGTAAPRARCARYSCLPVTGAPVPRRSGYPSAVVRPRPGRRRSRPPARPGWRRSFAPDGASHFFARYALPLSRAGAPGEAFLSRGRGSPPYSDAVSSDAQQAAHSLGRCHLPDALSQCRRWYIVVFHLSLPLVLFQCRCC